MFYQDVRKVVRINPLNTPFGHNDLEAVIGNWRGYRASADRRLKTMCWRLEAQVGGTDQL